MPQTSKKLKIAVVMGGPSAEREVSLATGVGAMRALKVLGHEVRAFDLLGGFQELSWAELETLGRIGSSPAAIETRPRTPNLLPVPGHPLTNGKIDVVFNALHGPIGEDGTIQAFFELLGLRYTGSGVLASALAMDKVLSKMIFAQVGVPTPPWVVVEEARHLPQVVEEIRQRLGFPVVVKPSGQGSTVGVTILQDPADLPQALVQARSFGPQVIVEQYIAGREMTVAVLDDRALPVVEIKPQDGFYDYTHKYTRGLTEYVCPAGLTADEPQEIQRLALLAFRSLRCRDYGRVDLRMDPQGRFYCLEVNTLPGLTETSLVPKAARVAGLEFPELIGRIVQLALDRA